MKRYSEERNKPRRYANNLPIGKLDRTPVLFYSHYRNNRDNCGICYGATNDVGDTRNDIFVKKKKKKNQIFLDTIIKRYQVGVWKPNEYASMI